MSNADMIYKLMVSLEKELEKVDVDNGKFNNLFKIRYRFLLRTIRDFKKFF